MATLSEGMSTADFKVKEGSEMGMSPLNQFQKQYRVQNGTSIAVSNVNHPMQQVQNVIDEVKIDGRYLAVAMANFAHLDFVLNWDNSIRKNLQLDKKLLVVCIDGELANVLKGHDIHTLNLSDLIDIHASALDTEKSAWSSEQTYGTATYNRLVNVKIQIAHIFLKYYNLEYLIYSDVDLVWLQPRLIQYFDTLLTADGLNYEILFSPGGTSSPPGTFYPCTGFYVMKKTDFSLTFLAALLTYPDKGEKHDQHIALQVYNHLDPALKLKIHGLDAVLFVDGSTSGWEAYYGVRPWVFHANYVVGYEKKKKLLQDFGYWYL